MTNSEKYKTAKERYYAFLAWCDQHGANCHKDADYGALKCAKCQFSWLDLEAEEESFEDVVEEMRKRMIDREHSPSLWPFVERLEVAHNRVAKKCMEVNHGS